MENNFEIDLSRGYLLIKKSIDNPTFIHYYIENNILKSSFREVKLFKDNNSYLEFLNSLEVPENGYIVEWTYKDDRIRKTFQIHTSSQRIIDYNLVVAKMRDYRINQILEDE